MRTNLQRSSLLVVFELLCHEISANVPIPATRPSILGNMSRSLIQPCQQSPKTHGRTLLVIFGCWIMKSQTSISIRQFPMPFQENPPYLSPFGPSHQGPADMVTVTDEQDAPYGMLPHPFQHYALKNGISINYCPDLPQWTDSGQSNHCNMIFLQQRHNRSMQSTPSLNCHSLQYNN